MGNRRSSLFIFALAFAAGCQPAGTGPAAPPVAPPLAAAADVALAPPPPGEGVQLSVGPFDVAPGTEVQRNFFMKLPVDQDVMLSRVQVAYPTGSHHCNIFKSDTKNADDHVEDSFEAIDYEAYQMFTAAQTGNLDWKYPEGVGLKLAKRQQLLIQTHWVNAATQKTPGGKGVVKINFWFAKPETIKTPLGMAFIINKNLDIPPRTESAAKKIVDLTRQGYKQDAKILAMTGHFHSRGKTFDINRFDGDKIGDLIYRSDNWDEPPFKAFDTPIDLKAGQKLLYTTTFVNSSDLVIKFGPKVETQEHSNLFMYFTPGPADGKAIYDTAGLP